MLGSSASISGANVVLNTAVAESLRQFADELEGADDFENALHQLICREIKEHKRIIFSGNGYDGEWVKEAEKRGLLNLPTTPDCVPYYVDQKNIELFQRHGVYSEIELAARYKMKLDTYSKVLNIEAFTMLDMVWHDILPAVSAYSKELTDAALSKKELGVEYSFEKELSAKISKLISEAVERVEHLESEVNEVNALSETYTRAAAYKERVLPAMSLLRETVDELETRTAKERWPYPSYADILFSVK